MAKMPRAILRTPSLPDAGTSGRPDAAERARRRPLFGLAVLVVFVALAVLAKLPIWESPLSRFSGLPPNVDPNDAMWFMSWLPYSLGHGISPFTSGHVNYPVGINLMWNTWMPAVGLLLSPLTVLGGPALSDNVATTGGLALAGFLAYLALHRYVHNRFAAAFGGLIYGFSPYMIAQDTVHAQMVAAAVTIPVALILVDETLIRQRINPWLLGLMLAAVGIFQFFVLEEYFVTEVGAIVLLTLILAALHPRRVGPRFRRAISVYGVAAVVTAAALAYPVIALQLHGPSQPVGQLHDPEAFVTDLLNPVIPTTDQLIAPGWATAISERFTGNVGEWNGYLGVGLLAVAVAAVVAGWRRTVVRAAALFAAAMLLLSLGPHLHVGGRQLPVPLPFDLLVRLPLLRYIQANRLTVYVYLAVALIAATALAAVWKRRHGIPLAGILAAAIVVPLLPTVPLPWEQLSVPRYFTTAMANDLPAGAGILAIPCPCLNPPDALQWQIASGMRFKLVGGYFIGPIAPGQDTIKQVATRLARDRDPRPLDSATAAAFRSELRSNGVGAVVMTGVPNPAGVVAVVDQVLGFGPTEHDGVYVWILPLRADGG